MTVDLQGSDVAGVHVRDVTDFHVYDTTLRDGAQQEGLSLSVNDKLAIAGYLDDLGVGFIEGGWPGAIPKDTEFFARAASELKLRHAVLAAFGATRRPGITADADPQVRALLDSRAPVVTLVAKCHPRHVELALRTTLRENLDMVGDTVAVLVREGRRVVLDAEHFFDGYADDPAYALEVVRRAAESGSEVVTLCDTNGGMLPHQVASAVHEVVVASGARVGIHCHNDTGCAVANTLAAVQAGATHVQGTMNGYGERTGNADLVTVVANLVLKQGMPVLDTERLRDATRIAHAISEITNVVPYSRQPYVGASAFAHKAGLHASAIKVDPALYQHADPTQVGNDMRLLVSDMAGRASIELKGRELGFDLAGQGALLTRVTERVKALEARGYTFDAADASFELLLREEVDGSRPSFCDVESWRVITESGPSSSTLSRAALNEATAAGTSRGPGSQVAAQGSAMSEATVKLVAGGRRVVATGEGNGPVNALDQALRQALLPAYPEIERLQLIDFRVRIVDAAHGTDATTRVLIETSDGVSSWNTVGIADNIVEASWEALVDGISYGLVRQGVARR